ncbi:hypothetical protein [Streptomyces hygroscopicus]|uniref:hypothetical protein n=1 Tax=Streptomyces hygroscopicus TaxID=1912 RepID=UPI00378775F4
MAAGWASVFFSVLAALPLGSSAALAFASSASFWTSSALRLKSASIARWMPWALLSRLRTSWTWL